MSAPAAPALPPPSRPPAWLWILPRVALLLSSVAIAVLLWLLHRSEVDEQHQALIGDALWIEQDLRFHLDRHVDLLRSLGLDRVSNQIDAQKYELRARHILGSGEGIVQILFVDASGAVRSTLPVQSAERMVGEALGTSPAPDTFRLAMQLGTPQYSSAYHVVGQDAQFEIHVPLFYGNQFAGAMVGIYSLRTLLAQLVPWWFAERYKLNVVDDNRAVLASKTNVTARDAVDEHTVPFDPPGHGLMLQLLSYGGSTPMLPLLLVATIIALSMAIVWSLRALRRHILGRHEAERALRAEHAFRKAMEDSLVTGMVAVDHEGRVSYVNPAFCRMVGWPEDELTGHAPPLPFWPPEETQRPPGWGGAENSPPPGPGRELRLLRKDGERIDTLVHEAPLIDASGTQTGWLASVLDITARKRAEELARAQQERLQLTSRLVTMGELASTLAHELNQPLAAIASYNAGCLNRLEHDDYDRAEIIEASRKLGTQAQRAGQIIRRIHEFVRRSAPKRAACDLAAVIEDAVGLIEPDARKRQVRFALDLPQPLPRVLADRGMIEQVILNLLRNAIDAMQETAPAQRVAAIGVGREDGTLVVGVADRGCGIGPEVAAKLFAPFFTTKETGMGMGLNICRSIVELHQGQLWFEPREGGGTVFRFSLPLAAP
jgi:two-component system sensor histidine kinase DctS